MKSLALRAWLRRRGYVLVPRHRWRQINAWWTRMQNSPELADVRYIDYLKTSHDSEAAGLRREIAALHAERDGLLQAIRNMAEAHAREVAS